MTLIERFRIFVRFLKTDDKPAGEDLLKAFETLPVKETSEFGFSLRESAMILLIILEHQKRLTEVEKSLHA